MQHAMGGSIACVDHLCLQTEGACLDDGVRMRTRGVSMGGRERLGCLGHGALQSNHTVLSARYGHRAAPFIARVVPGFLQKPLEAVQVTTRRCPGL